MISRPLTDAERNLAASVFGGAIDYSAVRLFRRSWWPLQTRRIAMSPNGNIYFHSKSDLWADDLAAAHVHRQGLFIYEMTHVWQHQKGIWLPLASHHFCRYSYSLKPGWPLHRYGLEQQDEIVRHAFLLRQGAAVPGAPPLNVAYCDSLCVDAEGNVIVATIVNGGVTSISPDGARVQHTPCPDPLTTNACFGGPELRTLYVTLSTRGELVAFDNWPTRGLPLIQPGAAAGSG